ncbi:MAG TPA: hypothetical protein VGN07_10025 [Steroidobacteraceae bacterium]|jgi:hypothetical protein
MKELPSALLILGGSIFAVLGLLHALYTFTDIGKPRRIVPDDPAVIAAMAASKVRLARGGTTMWKAWVGFNFSHSLGALIFAFACIMLGLLLQTHALPKSALLLPVAIGIIYFVLAVNYWFSIPTIGIAAATLCFIVSWALY